MATSQVRLERRAAQRFDFHRSVSIRRGFEEGHGFTQDLSARGMFLYTDMVLNAGDDLEVVLEMPAEITLSPENRVRCQVRVLRVAPAAANRKSGVALLVRNYEFLKEAAPVLRAAETLDAENAVLAGGLDAWSVSSVR